MENDLAFYGMGAAFGFSSKIYRGPGPLLLVIMRTLPSQREFGNKTGLLDTKKGPSPWRRSSLRSCQSMLQIDLAFLLLLDFGKPFLNFTE
jgi:hypothetical protein